MRACSRSLVWEGASRSKRDRPAGRGRRCRVWSGSAGRCRCDLLGRPGRPRTGSTSSAAALGVATTDGVFALAAAVGGGQLQTLLRPASGPLAFVAAVVLIVMAVRTVVAGMHRHRGTADASGTGRAPLGPLRAYLALVAVTALNPTTLIYFTALVLGGGHSQAGLTVVDAVGFALGAFLASASWQLFLAGSGAVLGRLITGGRGQLTVALMSGAIMIALAGNLLAS